MEKVGRGCALEGQAPPTKSREWSPGPGPLGQDPRWWWGPTVCGSHSLVLEAPIHESSPNKVTFPAYWSSSSGWAVWSHSCQHSTIVLTVPECLLDWAHFGAGHSHFDLGFFCKG